jgi:hypothetical protein
VGRLHGPGDLLRQHGLAGTRLALDEERPLQGDGSVDRDGIGSDRILERRDTSPMRFTGTENYVATGDLTIAVNDCCAMRISASLKRRAGC